MEIYEVKIYGTGLDINKRTVNIDKTFTVDIDEYKKAKTANDFRGQALNEYLNRVVPFHYPNVLPKNVSVSVSKKKAPTNADDFEKFIAGAATGYVIGKSKKSKNEPQHISSEYSFVDNIQGISEISFYTSDVHEIKTNLDKIYNEIIDFKWKSTGQDKDENKVIDANNRVLNMCVRNYATGLKKLQLISSDAEENIHYDKKYKKLKRKRFFNKYGVYVYAGLGLMLIMLILAAME